MNITEKYSKFIINYLFYFLFSERNYYGNSQCFEYIGSNQIQYQPSSHVFNVIGDVMNVSHDHFGNLRRRSRMTTEKYGKINTKRKSNRKSTEFVHFLAVSRYRQLYLLDIFSYYVYIVHVKILQNNQQIKELQVAYENCKRFTISLNGTYAKL